MRNKALIPTVLIFILICLNTQVSNARNLFDPVTDLASFLELVRSRSFPIRGFEKLLEKEPGGEGWFAVRLEHGVNANLKRWIEFLASARGRPFSDYDKFELAKALVKYRRESEQLIGKQVPPSCLGVNAQNLENCCGTLCVGNCPYALVTRVEVGHAESAIARIVGTRDLSRE